MTHALSVNHDGFSLIEVIIATGILAAALVTVSGLLIASSDALLAARQRTVAATLASAVTILLLYCIFRGDWQQAMFASRWFVVFLPMLLFWMGAWVRRHHKPGAWVFASVLMGFSVLVGIVGATEPFPAEGFRTYTALDATRRLISSQPSETEHCRMLS
jgi:prepilin-type N-terminal cleavage/methylation domain-containing protein